MGRAKGIFGVVLVFALGLATGWLGASIRAEYRLQALERGGPDAFRRHMDEELIRALDLTEEQKRAFLAAREEAHQEMLVVIGRSRPQAEAILRRADAKIRPLLSPRQLAVYDRIEQERRQHLPERPPGTDN